MVIAITILSIICGVLIFALFFSLRALVNAVDIIEASQNITQETSYDGVEYPCTLINFRKYSAEYDGIITDFSLYDTKNIIAMTTYYRRKPLEEEMLLVDIPLILNDAIVYQPMKGVFSFKLKT